MTVTMATIASITSTVSHGFINETLADTVPTSVNTIGFVVLGILSVVGSFGNVLTIIAVFKHNKLRKMCNIYVVNLAVVDLIVSALLTPISVYTMSTNVKPIGCNHILPFVSMTCTTVSILNFSAIAVNRYVAILKSAKYKQYFSNVRSVLSVIVIWIVGAMTSLPPVVGFGTYGYDERFGICFVPGYSNENYWYILGVSTIFTAPFLITTGFSYTQIMRKFYKVQKQRASHNINTVTTEMKKSNAVIPITVSPTHLQKDPQTSDGINCDKKERWNKKDKLDNIQLVETKNTLTENNDETQSKVRVRRQYRKQMDMFRVAFNCIVIWVFYLVVWTPVLALHVADYRDSVDHVYYRVLFVVAYSNFAVNAFLYAGMNRNFREAFRDILTCEPCLRNKRTRIIKDNTYSSETT